MNRRQIMLCIFALFFVSILVPQALAENEPMVYDFTNDFQSYLRMVADLNQRQTIFQVQGTEAGGKKTAIQRFALLCRTDGRKIDFERLSASYIIAGPRNCFTLFFSSDKLCQSAVSSLQEMDGIIYAEPDCEVHASGITKDGSEPSSHSFHSWGASQMNIGDYLDYTEGWGNGSASIAVIDSGVFPHSLIRGKMLSSGYDYVDSDEDSFDDPFGHGTNVAGIIVDCTADEHVYIYPIRVLNSSGSGKMSNTVNAVREAKQRGVTIINLSLESSVMSDALDDAILEAVSSGIIVVVAAGNSSCNTSEVCPAHLTNSGVIVVGAAEGNNGLYNIASYSNYGASVDVYAFGTDISCCSNSGGYSTETGTSMAAPHISSLCALIHIVHPGLSPGQAEYRLRLAALGNGTVVVPDSSLMIPATEGFSLSSVMIPINDILPLPSHAFPLTASETITYDSSDKQVVEFENGVLRAKDFGNAVITVSCKGFEDSTFMITVVENYDASLVLPSSLEAVDDEAFYGLPNLNKVTVPASVRRIGNYAFDCCDSLWKIEIPESVSEIGNNSFSDAVILCVQGSIIQRYAEERNLQYISLE